VGVKDVRKLSGSYGGATEEYPFWWTDKQA
jgi:hypothetical protein